MTPFCRCERAARLIRGEGGSYGRGLGLGSGLVGLESASGAGVRFGSGMGLVSGLGPGLGLALGSGLEKGSAERLVEHQAHVAQLHVGRVRARVRIRDRVRGS